MPGLRRSPVAAEPEIEVGQGGVIGFFARRPRPQDRLRPGRTLSGHFQAALAGDEAVGKTGHETHLDVYDRLRHRQTGGQLRQQPGQNHLQHAGEVLDVLPGHQVAFGRLPHGVQEARRRITGQVAPSGAAHAARLAKRIASPTSRASSASSPARTSATPAASGRPCGTLASGAKSRTVPRLVFLPTAARVARTDWRTTAPTPATAGRRLHRRRDQGGAGEEVVEGEVSKVRAPVDVARLGAETAQRQARVAHWPIDSGGR